MLGLFWGRVCFESVCVEEEEGVRLAQTTWTGLILCLIKVLTFSLSHRLWNSV